MDKSLIIKMIDNALKQYHTDSTILNEQDYEYLYQKISSNNKETPDHLLYDLVQDAVYGYVTDSPYF
ncbi:YqzH family protein [Niallia nealsonii]|uniref:YqzH-like protein n=1 Tax=Niallia nealsonii TaxID=115979 RepID=A0A2N0YX92_9BACI|nr:YqzH family protein [Niallia nealsonii]PKG21875.1 hypothetical protein CWS01_20115 [Niallia nealsonii]